MNAAELSKAILDGAVLSQSGLNTWFVNDGAKLIVQIDKGKKGETLAYNIDVLVNLPKHGWTKAMRPARVFNHTDALSTIKRRLLISTKNFSVVQ